MNSQDKLIAYRMRDTEICHAGRLGVWCEGNRQRSIRWARCILEGAAFAFLIFGFCALCAVA